MDLALEELGRRPGTLAGEACFLLAGRLGSKLSPQDAAQALDEACNQYQDIAPADTADGPVNHLAPAPQSAGSCLAGFIWAALGDAAIATRWQAAHAVCVLISLHAVSCTRAAGTLRGRGTPGRTLHRPASSLLRQARHGLAPHSRWNARLPPPTAPASNRSSRSCWPWPRLMTTTS